MLREFEYLGHEVQATVLPEQGRWAYRIDGAEVHCSRDIGPAAEEDVLYALAEAAAKAHIDATERLRVLRAEVAVKARAGVHGAGANDARPLAAAHRARHRALA